MAEIFLGWGRGVVAHDLRDEFFWIDSPFVEVADKRNL